MIATYFAQQGQGFGPSGPIAASDLPEVLNSIARIENSLISNVNGRIRFVSGPGGGVPVGFNVTYGEFRDLSHADINEIVHFYGLPLEADRHAQLVALANYLRVPTEFIRSTLYE